MQSSVYSNNYLHLYKILSDSRIQYTPKHN